MNCSPPGSFVHGDFPGKNTGVACHTLLQVNLPNSKIKLRSPALQMDFYHLRYQGSPTDGYLLPFSEGPHLLLLKVSELALTTFSSPASNLYTADTELSPHQ